MLALTHSRYAALVLAGALLILVSIAVVTAQTPSAPVEPTIVGPGVISTEAPEFSLTFTPDRREVYFTRAAADRSRLTVMTSRRTSDTAWSPAVPASFSGTHRDLDPFVTPDGRRLYFTSDRPRRPGAESRLATWYVERTASGWGPPVDPGSPMNSDAGDVFVSTARDGTVLFTSSRDGASAVYATREVDGRWQVPERQRLGAVADAGNPAIAPSGRFVVVSRAAAGGPADLFVSCRTAAGWDEPRPLSAAVNSPFSDFAPSIDAAETRLAFTSERPGVIAAVAAGTRPPGDLYEIGLAAAGIRCP